MTGSAETGRVVQRPSLICFISAASSWPGQEQSEGPGGGGDSSPCQGGSQAAGTERRPQGTQELQCQHPGV